MIECIRRSGLLIPRSFENTETYVKIKEELTRRTQSYDRSNYTYNMFYIESEKFLLIPRNFPLHKYIFSLSIKPHQHEGAEINIQHNITPRGEAQKRAIDYMLSNNNGILQLAPGVGKTVIAIYMIADRKKKSLILVHRDSLADQWRDRFKQFTNLQDEDISRLTSTTFIDDFQKPIIISTTQTFLSLLKRKREDFLVALNDAKIGIFIADEVHTSVGAPTFSECSIHMPSAYTYGLSATPYRYDGNGDIIEYHLGPIFSDEDATGTMDARVSVFLLDYKIDTPYRTKYIRYGGEFQRSRYLNLMLKSKPFQEAIRGLLSRLKDSHNLICMVERIKLIDDLYDWIPSNDKSKFCSSAKNDQLEYKVTFATPGKCRDGVDAPRKDCVITTSPISNIEQLTGRVVREIPGKQTPAIVDMVDYGCREISRTFYGRKTFYEKKGWPIQYFVFANNELKPTDEHTAIEIIEGV
jgi:superfamily II DNA or RNA helicase